MSLKKLIREVVGRLMLWTGVADLARRLLWRDRVAILLYHDPSPESLDRHLAYLARICTFIPLSDIDKPSAGRPRAVITIDDGNAGNARLLPIFVKHNVKPTIFVCSAIVGTRRQFWWLHEGAKREGIARLRRVSNTERLVRLKRWGFSPLSEMSRSALSSEDIAAMKPWTDFQAHGRFHPVLPNCSDDECETEIVGSRHEIEQLVGAPCMHFAYPNGRYGAREIAFLKAAGYRSARTCDVGWNDASTDPFRLKGIPVDDEASIAWLAAKLTGIPLYLRYLLGGRFDGRMPQV